MKKFTFNILALLAFVSVSGCVTNGQYFPSDLSWIKSDETTQQNVRSILGAPHSVGSSGGTPTWTYGYYVYKLFGTSRTKELKFYWHPDARVKTYSFNSSFPDDTKIQQKSASTEIP
ncbi:MAG: outer membrane protein assembly factor BamE [Oligoflexales bacterium]|nr:outer membrane protein assembly factor BamE [Oligoflexales bacterium]